MDKEEILKRNLMSNPEDEGIVFAENKSRLYGIIGVCVIFIIITIYNFVKSVDNSDVLALFWGFLTMESVGKYRILRGKIRLIIAIISFIATIGCFMIHVHISGWG